MIRIGIRVLFPAVIRTDSRTDPHAVHYDMTRASIRHQRSVIATARAWPRIGRIAKIGWRESNRNRDCLSRGAAEIVAGPHNDFILVVAVGIGGHVEIGWRNECQ